MASVPRITATSRLDPVLASRCIVLPLVPTDDPVKANADPGDNPWPCVRRALLEDLWAVSLHSLTAMHEHARAVKQDPRLHGRTLDPWRPVLAVAHGLDQAGEAGLDDRMTRPAAAYQNDREDREQPNLDRLAVEALIEIVETIAPRAPIKVAVSTVTAITNRLAVELEMTEPDRPLFSATKVGKTLTSLRLTRAPKSSGQSRQRITSLTQINKLARAYKLRDITLPPANPASQGQSFGSLGQMGLTADVLCPPSPGPGSGAEATIEVESATRAGVTSPGTVDGASPLPDFSDDETWDELRAKILLDTVQQNVRVHRSRATPEQSRAAVRGLDQVVAAHEAQDPPELRRACRRVQSLLGIDPTRPTPTLATLAR